MAVLVIITLSVAAQGRQVNGLDRSTIIPSAIDTTMSCLMKASESHSVKPVSLLGLPSPEDLMTFEEARSKVLCWPHTMPNLMCQQSVDRFMQHSQGRERKHVDTVTAEVTHVDGRDSYKQISINREPAHVKEMGRLHGYAMASDGEFSNTLMDLLSLDQVQTTDSLFATASLFDRPALVFDFRMEKGQNTTWQWWYREVFTFLKLRTLRIYQDYLGTLWIDTVRHEVLGLEIQAVDVDSKYPYDKMREAIDYDRIQAGGSNDPFAAVRAEVFDYERSVRIWSRNILIFKDCKEFVIKSRMHYEP